jgi:L-amino acid N-acyltransferase YncA
LGKILLNYLVEEGQKHKIDTFLACISSLNEQSIRFHLKNGFVECGRFIMAGKKLGRDFDMVWMQKFLK